MWTQYCQSQHIDPLRPKDTVFANFLAYLHESKHFYQWSMVTDQLSFPLFVIAEEDYYLIYRTLPLSVKSSMALNNNNNNNKEHLYSAFILQHKAQTRMVQKYN